MIRLLIADDHPVVREGLRRIVSECHDMSVVDEAVDGDQVLARIATGEVDVILLDISMPGPSFLDLVHQLRSEQPRVRILVLSAHPEDQYAVRALKAGAAGYLTKDHTPEQLAEAIRRVFRGGKYVSQALAERLAFELEPDAVKAPHQMLSNREFQVLCMFGSGKGVKEIAAALSLSPKTISTYRARILGKLNLNTTADLIRYTVEHHLEA